MRPPKLLVALSVLLALGTSDAAPPHITFFLVDDLGWNDVSMHGSKQIQTPNIDSLAASGIRLNNYYVNPVCSPTRASLMSGRSIIHHGIYTPYGNGNTASGLNLSYTLLPEHLKASYGYATYMVGKWCAPRPARAHHHALPTARAGEQAAARARRVERCAARAARAGTWG